MRPLRKSVTAFVVLPGTDAQIVRPYRSRICACVASKRYCVRGFNGDNFNPSLTGGATWDWADVDRFVAQLLFVLYGRACRLQTDTEYTGAQSTGGRRITFAQSIY